MTRDTTIALGLGGLAIVVAAAWWYNSRTALVNEDRREVTVDVISIGAEAKKFEHVTYTDGQTALEVTNSVIVVATAERDGQTAVTSLGGIAALTPGAWVLRVNGQPVDVDPATYYVQPNDLLSWRLVTQ